MLINIAYFRQLFIFDKALPELTNKTMKNKNYKFTYKKRDAFQLFDYVRLAGRHSWRCKFSIRSVRGSISRTARSHRIICYTNYLMDDSRYCLKEATYKTLYADARTAVFQ